MAYTAIFSVNNNQEVFVLPHVPVDFPLPQPEQNNDTYAGLTRDYRRIGTMGLRTLSWSSFFPVGWRAAFMPKEARTNGWEYVSFFERWRPQKVPFRFIVLDSTGTTRLSMACTVDTFEPSVRRNGDIAYNITITEYPFVA